MMRQKAVVAILCGASIFAGMSQVGYAQNTLPELPPSTTAPAVPQPQDAAAPTAADANVPAPMPAAQVAPAAPGVPAVAGPAPMPAMPGLPPVTAVPGAVPAAGAVAAMPGAVPTPAPFGMMPTAPGIGVATAAPTPPPLGDISVQSADGATSPGATVGAAAAPSTTYSFLFVELPEYGVVRHKFNSDVAENLREKEILRLMDVRRNQQQPLGGIDVLGVTPMGPMGAAGMGLPPEEMMAGAYPDMAGAPGIAGANQGEALRAAAEWDFYYNQMELYNKYVREKLIPAAEDLPELAYEAQNALQERQDLFESFQEAAIEQGNQDYNANKMFYERLSKREDRRRAYLNWLDIQRQKVEDWSDVWARQVYGQRWADGEDVRLDDWYYGVDFNSAKPVLVAIDDREYVISRQPLRDLKDGQLNVISTNLTPYDIIDANGELKNPVMETLRGTLVVPPAPPVYTTNDSTGIIEIIGGVSTE